MFIAALLLVLDFQGVYVSIVDPDGQAMQLGVQPGSCKVAGTKYVCGDISILSSPWPEIVRRQASLYCRRAWNSWPSSNLLYLLYLCEISCKHHRYPSNCMKRSSLQAIMLTISPSAFRLRHSSEPQGRLGETMAWGLGKKSTVRIHIGDERWRHPHLKKKELEESMQIPPYFVELLPHFWLHGCSLPSARCI